jgi:hypothetical protein
MVVQWQRLEGHLPHLELLGVGDALVAAARIALEMLMLNGAMPGTACISLQRHVDGAIFLQDSRDLNNDL